MESDPIDSPQLEKKLSATALSYAVFLPFILCTIACALSAARYGAALYTDPLSAYFAERDRSFRRIVTVAQREVLRA